MEGWQEGPQKEHAAHSEAPFLSHTDHSSKSDSGRAMVFLALTKPQQVCGWFNLVATSPTVCQMGEQKGQAEVRHSRAQRALDAKNRSVNTTAGRKGKQNLKTPLPVCQRPSFSSPPQPACAQN